jgi:hypothetical protein
VTRLSLGWCFHPVPSGEEVGLGGGLFVCLFSLCFSLSSSLSFLSLSFLSLSFLSISFLFVYVSGCRWLFCALLFTVGGL